MANRNYLLRYWLADEVSHSRRSGADFACECGKVEYDNYMGDYMRYRNDCPRCHGTGRYVRKLSRREHHVLKVNAEVNAKVFERMFDMSCGTFMASARQIGKTLSQMAWLDYVGGEKTVGFDDLLGDVGLTYDDLEVK